MRLRARSSSRTCVALLFVAAIAASTACEISHVPLSLGDPDASLSDDGVPSDVTRVDEPVVRPADSLEPTPDVVMGPPDGPCGARNQVCCAGGQCGANLDCWGDDHCRCGSVSQPCCAPGAGTSRCDPDTECLNEQCRCGRLNEVCCAGRMCVTGLSCGSSGRCTPPPTCSNVSESCSVLPCCSGLSCGGGSTCEMPATCAGAGSLCSATSPCCAGLMCDTGRGVCVPMAVCANMGESCSGRPCCMGLACNGTTCGPPAPACGGAGQTCCTGGSCATGNRCVAPYGVMTGCAVCGSAGNFCCPGGSCRDGSYCSGSLTSLGWVCIHMRVGSAPGERCAGAVGSGNNCSAGFVCRAANAPDSRCLACGGLNQACCGGGSPCGSRLRCMNTSSVASVCVPM